MFEKYLFVEPSARLSVVFVASQESDDDVLQRFCNESQYATSEREILFKHTPLTAKHPERTSMLCAKVEVAVVEVATKYSAVETFATVQLLSPGAQSTGSRVSPGLYGTDLPAAYTTKLPTVTRTKVKTMNNKAFRVENNRPCILIK